MFDDPQPEDIVEMKVKDLNKLLRNVSQLKRAIIRHKERHKEENLFVTFVDEELYDKLEEINND